MTIFSSKHLVFVYIAVISSFVGAAQAEHGCVWKVTGPGGHVLYLGGSIHALRSSDYPLPTAYNRAFDLSERLVFEDDPDVNSGQAKRFLKTMEYPKGDSLKDHIDPRTYDYLKRVFTRMGAKDEKFAQLRPWGIIMLLWSPQLSGLSSDLGIEGFLERRARANGKSISGLETFQEHLAIISGLTDRQAEAVILITFIPQANSKEEGARALTAWRRGDVDTLASLARAQYADFPAFGRRLLDERNRTWIPKIEQDLASGHIFFVVVGAAHFGGPNGLLALLKGRGYQVEPL